MAATDDPAVVNDHRTDRDPPFPPALAGFFDSCFEKWIRLTTSCILFRAPVRVAHLNRKYQLHSSMPLPALRGQGPMP